MESAFFFFINPGSLDSLPSKLYPMKNKPVIVINRMYAGSYLQTHLGHEVINLIQADNGCFYLYLNPYGNLTNRSTQGGIMLLTKLVNRYCHEVIGIAPCLQIANGVVGVKNFSAKLSCEQKNYIKNQPQGDIRYGGVSIIDLFDNNDQQDILVTYKAMKVVRPKDNVRIFIQYADCSVNRKIDATLYDTSYCIVVDLSNRKAPSTALRSFIYGEGKDENDYRIIFDEIINNPDLWEATSVPKLNLNLTNHKRRGISIFDICRIQDDENCISNAFAWFMAQPQYQDLWKGFFNAISPKTISWSGDLSVQREVNAGNNGRIDILARDHNNVIVIENKIKSDVIKSGGNKVSQLSRYYGYIKKAPEFKGLTDLFILLTPGYSTVRLTGINKRNWIHITYKCLYDYLTKNLSVICGDSNFMALYDVLLRHTFPTEGDFLYHEMQEKLIERIVEIKKNNNNGNNANP